MNTVIIIIILFYMLSTAGYFAYLVFQKDYLQRAGYYLLLTGFLCHSAAICYEFVKTGDIPVHSLHEILLITGWSIAGVFSVFQYKFNLKVLGVYASPLAGIIMIVALQLPGEPAEAREALDSFWPNFHVIALLIGKALFALACGVGLMYLAQEHAIKTKNHGFFFRRLPSLEPLDSAGYVCIAAGFIMLTIGLVAGLIHAKSVWGSFWGWDPKEISSGITWFLYAVMLHERLAAGWRGRRAAIMAIVGFAVLLFTFFGVNLLIEGHHGEFGRW